MDTVNSKSSSCRTIKKDDYLMWWSIHDIIEVKMLGSVLKRQLDTDRANDYVQGWEEHKKLRLQRKVACLMMDTIEIG